MQHQGWSGAELDFETAKRAIAATGKLRRIRTPRSKRCGNNPPKESLARVQAHLLEADRKERLRARPLTHGTRSYWRRRHDRNSARNMPDHGFDTHYRARAESSLALQTSGQSRGPQALRGIHTRAARSSCSGCSVAVAACVGCDKHLAGDGS